ncbi:hypothetical protein A1O7_01421 [Cladophialophora yegresii CBS 114405]|uniref:Heterokaryon incompatibility domain-containing protein n=1 Tax=Cladophialophora yegresii CBS 114405 TaxID=1182544 RepID=W9WKC9_9EURO|nr:uncharacterized protein A1O7_01421 [Cladophialophora yegresii CBS 114405]EXJ65081.1 hypothetical protein A1O7_01421 [Cladophialophora yegresii CBS 114405]
MASLQIKSLTKNFQHAIRITRALKVRYLWIDSLCIVQDDDAEWEAQSADMGLVYANAECVVSASASRDSDGGCFRPQDLFRSDCVLRKSSFRSIEVEASDDKSFAASLKLFKDRAENTVLSTRAWAFQERYLARRVLHFCEGVVFFECNNLIVRDGIRFSRATYPRRAGVRSDGTLYPLEECEAVRPPSERSRMAQTRTRRGRFRMAFSQPPPENPQDTARLDLLSRMLALSARSGMRGAFELLWRFKGTENAEKVEFHQSWYEIVEQYSTRKLTRESDKLKAMSGIAYFIQKNTAFRYAAGLWKGMLAFNLLWVVSSSPEERPARNIPSWSWGSVNGRISHRLQFPEPTEQLEGTNGTSQPFRFQSTWREITPLISEGEMEVIEQRSDLVLSARLSVHGHLHASTSLQVNIIHDAILPSASTTSGQLFYLPVLAFKNDKVHPVGSVMQIHGLVVRSKLNVRCTYERVGYFWTANCLGLKQVLERQRNPTSLVYLV